MNYQESALILDEIKKAKNVLVNCHRGPDPDSIGSALAMYRVLKDMGKTVKVICPSQELYESISYLEDYGVIQKGVNFSEFDFSKFDLFIALDSSSWGMVCGNTSIKTPGLKFIVIDHHTTNTKFGDINLVDKEVTSTGELLYKIFQDLKIEIEAVVANYLMVAIVGDTGGFRFPNLTSSTFTMIADLIDKGADKDKIIHHIYRSESFKLIKFYGKILESLKFEEEGRFVWAAIPYVTFKEYGKPATARESAASMFIQIVDGTDFGFLAIEEVERILSVSFRSRSGFDTSKIALKLGGGGHIYASGAKIRGLSYDAAVEKLLTTVRGSLDMTGQ
jgi:phosphoesterase RecJ-like protein